MVPEIPVSAGGVFNIGPEGDENSTGLEVQISLFQRSTQSGFIRQVLEKVAGENNIEPCDFLRPGCRTILLHEFYVGIQVLRGVRVQVHREFGPGAHVIDELAVAAAQVQHCGAGGNPSLKKALEEHLPDALAVSQISLKALGVNLG